MLGLHHPTFLALHFRPIHLPNRIPTQINRTPINVATTATTTLTKVILEHRQLKGRARSSHRSFHPSGQMVSVRMGASIPNGYLKTVLGTQVCDVSHHEQGYGLFGERHAGQCGRIQH